MHSLEAQLNNLSSNIFELKIELIVLEKSRVIFIFRVSIQIPLMHAFHTKAAQRVLHGNHCPQLLYISGWNLSVNLLHTCTVHVSVHVYIMIIGGLCARA